MKKRKKPAEIKTPIFFKLDNEEKLNRVLKFMINNKTRGCATTSEVAKKFEMSISSALRYMKHFTLCGHLIKDSDVGNLFWVNKNQN